ncbi:MAG TPA: sulfite exporter TauE/SafE family protein [Thermoanaerobaculia bacterium]|nr:sulfite exporter TauE/SafE family protein [Thermoanaerobaculia bacterium]
MPPELLWFTLAGFIAEMIDGSLGMGYGVSATTLLLSLGLPPAKASASVHTAEVFATGMSAAAHYRAGNVDWSLVRRLLIPGAIGAVIGAYILTSIPGQKIKPWIAAYLLVMGILILARATRAGEVRKEHRHLLPLGFVGGLLDAIGGGGWGPIVTGTLIARGNQPRTTIGSVNFSEFFITLAGAITFLLTIGISTWVPVIGLALGGSVAAPISAIVAKRIPARPLMVAVGVLVILLSLRTIFLALR